MRPRKLWVVLMAALMIMAIAVPAASADEVEEPIFELLLDIENERAVFWNITRDNFCDWADGGFEGPPPVETLIPGTIFFQDSGVILGHYDGVAPLELWELDDDVPPYIGPCEDTDGQDGPWATGYARGEGTDDDLTGAVRRTNTFGIRGNGTVYDGAGAAYAYSWTFHYQVKRGEFNVLVEDQTLTPL